MSARRLAVLSATDDPRYAFFAPLTARLWRDVAVHEPLVLLVGDEAAWCGGARTALVLDRVREVAEVAFVPRVPGVADHTVAQVARLLAAALPGDGGDYLLVGDVDMWPLDRAHFAPRDPAYAFHALHADAYGRGAERLPMCYLGATRAAWRDLLELGALSLPEALARIPWPPDGDWHFDERYVSARLLALPQERWLRVARPTGPDHGRIDRADWRLPASLDGFVDAHLPRPAHEEPHWSQVAPLLARLLSGEALRWALDYREAFVAAGKAAAGGDDLERWYRLWFKEFARVAPEPYRSYGGYGDGEPNGTACSVEAVRAFARRVGDRDATVLNAGAGASSFLLRRLFPRVTCVDADAPYLDVVRGLCAAHGLSEEGFVVGLENAPDADFVFYDYGEITPAARMGYHDMAYRKARRGVYFDDADDRPHAFPQYRRLVLDFAAGQGVAAEDCRDATDRYGRWGVFLTKPGAVGAPTRVIAFSLFGRDPMYTRGAVENVPLAARHYPGWRVCVYVDDDRRLSEVAREVTGGLDMAAWAERHGVALDVVSMGPSEGIRGMFWRFLAAADQRADAVVFRDCDSRLNPREAAAVGAWLASGRRFHVMKDHPDHAPWPMLGGMWGVRGGVLDDIDRRIAAWGRWGAKLDDMHFLSARVWPEALRSMVHHASAPGGAAPSVPFPAHAPWRGFVGEIVR